MVRVYDRSTLHPLLELPHGDPVNSIEFLPSSKVLASCGKNKTLKLWEVPSGRLLKTIDLGEVAGEVRAFPDGNRFAVVCNHSIRLIEWRSGKQAIVPAVNQANYSSLAISPDGSLLLTTGTDKRPRLWSVGSHRVVAELPVTDANCLYAAFSPDGRLAAVSTWNGEVLLWDIPHRKRAAYLFGHFQAGNFMAFSPDGKTLAMGGADGFLQLWDTATWKPTVTLKGHTNEIENGSSPRTDVT